MDMVSHQYGSMLEEWLWYRNFDCHCICGSDGQGEINVMESSIMKEGT